MTGYQSKKKAASAKTIDEVNWLDHEPDGRRAEQDATMQSLKDLWRSVCDEVGKAAFAQPAQEPPKYSFKAYWTEDGRIGVVACIERPDGGVHLMEAIIDPPQEKNNV
jgi:hypothetical protein